MIENKQLDALVTPGPDAYLSPRGPFQNSHNLLHFFGGAGRGEVLSRLVWHVHNSDDTFWVRGEAGSGKTLLGLVLANRCNKKFRVIRCDQHSLSANSLLLLLNQELSRNGHSRSQEVLAHESGDVENAPMSSPVIEDLQKVVDGQGDDIRPYLLIIDNPGQLSVDTRILIGRLNSVCRNGYPVFRVVVFETLDSTDERLHPSLEEELLSNVAYLNRFSLYDVRDYLEHHMMLFDYSQRDMFSREMAYFVADRSEGLVREINALVRNAFTIAGIQNEYRLSMSHLLMAGLPEKPPEKTSSVRKVIKNGGFRLAIIVASTLVLSLTLFITR